MQPKPSKILHPFKAYFSRRKPFPKLLLILGSSLLLSQSLVRNPSVAAASCPVNGEMMSKVELYFGLDIPGGGQVDSTQWQAFVNREVTPRFPDGLTIDEVSGQWQDATTGETIQESSRVIMILYSPSTEAEQSIEAIRNAYKVEFNQDAVMRLDESNCVSF